jgi:hypothetical protein
LPHDSLALSSFQNVCFTRNLDNNWVNGIRMWIKFFFGFSAFVRASRCAYIFEIRKNVSFSFLRSKWNGKHAYACKNCSRALVHKKLSSIYAQKTEIFIEILFGLFEKGKREEKKHSMFTCSFNLTIWLQRITYLVLNCQNQNFVLFSCLWTFFRTYDSII